MKRIYLIDCPGVVPPNGNDSEVDILLRGVVRVENVENPEQYITAVLAKTKPRHIERTYEISGYNTTVEFLELLARKGGRLLKGGDCDLDGVAKMVINDFLRGKIPWFTPPPGSEEKEMRKAAGAGIDGRIGKLGEMGKKRKVEDITQDEETEKADSVDDEVDGEEDEGDDASDGDSIEDLSVGSLSGDGDSDEEGGGADVTFEGFGSGDEEADEKS